jgi:hypothetical protein
VIVRFWGGRWKASAGRIVSGAMAAGVLAALALSAPLAVHAAEAEGRVPRSEAAARVANWIAASGDNGSLPYIIIDKNAANLFLFDADGQSAGEAPVLIGIAPGDEASPGIGSKDLSKIGPAEKTTPAGRFLAKFGLAAGNEKVLWVDYHTSVALHPVVTGNKKERRRERLLSETADDNRITFGCINVPPSFYSRSITPLFQKSGGIVYVLPDTKDLEEVFPLLRVQPFLDSGILTVARTEE